MTLNLSLLLILTWLFLLLDCIVHSKMPADGDGILRYTNEGSLEVSYEAKQDGSWMEKRLEAPLFFEAEKNNRHVFNLDICIDFFDRNGSTLGRKGSVFICYETANKNITRAKNDENNEQAKQRLNSIEAKCGKGRHGLELEFLPDSENGLYLVTSWIDQKMYTVNITDFEKDEVKVYRPNRVPKFCLRLEMGRLPPDEEEVARQQQLVLAVLNNALLDAVANNKSDNLTKLFGGPIPEVTLQVEDVKEEFTLRTVDLSAHKDAQVLDQQDRTVRTFLGIYANATREELNENRTLAEMKSKLLYEDFVPKLRTDKNYKAMPKNVFNLDLHFRGIHFLNISFNGGNIFPCRTEWVELDKFAMERDFFHEAIHEEFSPIQMAYTVGLVGWKNESDRGFGPGYEKKGIFGPGKDDLKDLRKILLQTEGILKLEQRYKDEFMEPKDLANMDEIFQKLEEYYVSLWLNDMEPLGEITVKQLVFVCSDYTFNLPHVASYTAGHGL